MDADRPDAALPEGPWNPGIQSELPPRLVPLSTIFRPENVFTSVAQATELHAITALPLEELAIFRPERLVVHEVLVRVTTDISVPDPDTAGIDDLGINFREIVRTIITVHIAPHMPGIVALYASIKASLAAAIEAELAAFPPAPPARPAAAPSARGRWAALFGRIRRRDAAPVPAESRWQAEERGIQAWVREAASTDDPVRRAACRALVRLVSAVRGRHGRWWGERELLSALAVDLACNAYCTRAIGRHIEPLIEAASAAEGYARLSMQARPVIMNVKGTSASGKSTMRPLQRKMAAGLGVRWRDFALISPDIWRKYLLDYDSLGADYKYAGALAGRELEIIDRKLDRHMARKAAEGGISHLLIDRFRFDSFAPDSQEAGSNLLTRFGDAIYMFFMITSPHETVARAWTRGLDVGRYKAVDDLLAHNIEAYGGMPALFFTWALCPGKTVYCEFLDNDVPRGERPRTVAFSRNGELNILDVKGLLDIERYHKINAEATTPDEVYADHAAMAAENNTMFLGECVRTLPAVNFADRDSGRIYASFRAGQLDWCDPPILERFLADAEAGAGLRAVMPDGGHRGGATGPARILPLDRVHTVGRWGRDIVPG